MNVNVDIPWIYHIVSRSYGCLRHDTLRTEYEKMDVMAHGWMLLESRNIPVSYDQEIPSLLRLASIIKLQESDPNQQLLVPSDFRDIWEFYSATLTQEFRLIGFHSLTYRSKVLREVLHDTLLCTAIDSLLMDHSWVLVAYPAVKREYDEYTSTAALRFSSDPPTHPSEYIQTIGGVLDVYIDTLVALALKYRDIISGVSIVRHWRFPVACVLASFVEICAQGLETQGYEYPNSEVLINPEP